MAKKHTLKQSDVPAEFFVLGTRVLVKVQKIPKAPDEERCYGEYVSDIQTVLLDPSHPAHNLQDTVVHELIHAAFHLSGVSALTDATPNLEEAIVRAITSAFAPAIDLTKLAGSQVNPTSVDSIK